MTVYVFVDRYIHTYIYMCMYINMYMHTLQSHTRLPIEKLKTLQTPHIQILYLHMSYSHFTQ